MPGARLHALRQLLAGFIDQPDSAVLVIGCTDLEIIYLTLTLEALDLASCTDRFWVVAEPFAGPRAYVEALENSLHPHLDLPPQLDPPASPLDRLITLLNHSLAALPDGDHHLVCALVPAQIDDLDGFARFAGSLLYAPSDPRLRLILRDDLRSPRTFDAAAASPCEQILANRFALPPELVVADVTAAAEDPSRPHEERAQALLQLASRDLGHGALAAALARCETVERMPVAPGLSAFATALRADISRRAGDIDAAVSAGSAALERAVAAGALPVAFHAAMALGDLAEEQGHRADAAACFSLAHRAAALNPALQQRAAARRDALTESPC